MGRLKCVPDEPRRLLGRRTDRTRRDREVRRGSADDLVEAGAQGLDVHLLELAELLEDEALFDGW
jgi:hypothetical protein